jgi:hypothetical protein
MQSESSGRKHTPAVKMAQFELRIPPASTGKTLVLCGIGIAGAFIASSRLLFASVFPYGFLRPILDSMLVSFLVLLMATVAAVVGTIALVRRPAPKSSAINFNDAAFFVVGLLASSAGIWLCATIGLELLLLA